MAERHPLLCAETSVSHSSAIVSASLLLTALLGAGQALLLVFIVGETDDTAAFLTAYSLYLIFALFGASLRGSMVPLLGPSEAGEQFVARITEIASRVLLLGLVLAVVLAAVSPLMGQLLTLGLPPDARWTAVLTLLILAPAAYLQIHGAALSAAFSAARRFVFSAVLYVIAGVVAVGCSAVLLSWVGALGAAIGLVAGSLVLALGHSLYMRRFGVHFRLRLRWLRERRQRELGMLLLAGAGIGLATQANLTISLAVMSSNPDAVTAYSYAFFLIVLMLTISSLPLSLVTLPDLVDRIAERGMAAAREHLVKVTPYAFAVLVPLLFAFAAFGKPLLEAMFASSLSSETIEQLYELALILGVMAIPTGLLFLTGPITLALGRSRRFLLVGIASVGVHALLVVPLSTVGPFAVAAGHVGSAVAAAVILLGATFGRGWPSVAIAALRRSAPAFALSGVIVVSRLPFGSNPGVGVASVSMVIALLAYIALAVLLWPSVSTAFVDLVKTRRARRAD